MKKSLFTLALASGLAFAGMAQETKPQSKSDAKPQKAKQEKANLSPEERAKNESDNAAKELGLTPEQKTKWETASLNRLKANAPIREKMKGSTTPEERKNYRSEARSNVQKFDSEVKSFLNDEQKAKWEAHKEKRKERAKNIKGKKLDPDHEPDIEG